MGLGKVARLRPHPREPGPDVRVRGEVEAGLVGAAGVGEHGDVGDPVTRAGGAPGLDQRRRAPRQLAGQPPAAQRADPAPDPLRLERQPLPDLGPAEPVPGQVRRALGEEHQDRVRFGQGAAVVQADRRHRAGGADRAVLRAPAFAAEDRDRFAAIGPAEVVQPWPHLPGVLRGQVVVKREHRGAPAGRAPVSAAARRGDIRVLRPDTPRSESVGTRPARMRA